MRWLVTCLALLVAGCPDKPADAPSRPLPAYSGHATELFDDAVEPAAVGLDVDRSFAPRSDALLRERAQVSDAVLRVRVATVTTKQEETGATFTIGLRPVEKLHGDHPPPGETFNVRIDKSSASQGIMKSFGARLVNRPFIAFVRLFVRPDGDSELHFHLSPDSKEMVSAVVDAISLQRLK